MQPATEPRPPDYGLDDLLRALRRHPERMAIVFVVVAPLAVLALRAVPRPYRAEAAVLVTYGHEFVSVSEVGDLARAPAFRLDEIVNSEVEVFKSRDLAADVVRELGAATLYPDLIAAGRPASAPDAAPDAAAVDRFQAATTVRAVRASAVIRVTFEHGDAELAARAANLLVERFTDKHLEVFSDPKAGFARAEARAHDRALAEAEDRLERFRRDNSLHDSAEQRRLLLARRAAVDALLGQARVERAELLARRAAGDRAALLQDGRVQVDASAPDARAVQEAQGRLLEAELRERTLLETHADSSRAVAAVRQEIAAARAFLAEREQEVDAARRAEVAAELAALEARRQGLAAEAARLVVQIEHLAGTERQLRGLERELATAETRAADAGARLEEARVGDELNRQRLANVRSLQRAVAPLERSGLPWTAQVILGACLGLACAVGAAILAEGARAPAA